MSTPAAKPAPSEPGTRTRERTGAAHPPEMQSGTRQRADAPKPAIPDASVFHDSNEASSGDAKPDLATRGRSTHDSAAPPKPDEAAINGTLSQPAEQGEKTPGKNASDKEAPAKGAPAAVGKDTTARSALAARPFFLKAYKWSANNDQGPIAEATATIQSSTLDRGILAKLGITDAGKLTLFEMRKQIPPMSKFSSIHRFCTSDGTYVNDEFTGLGEYFEFSESSAATSLNIYYRSTVNPGNGTAPNGTVSGGEGLAGTAPNLGLLGDRLAAGSTSVVPQLGQLGPQLNPLSYSMPEHAVQVGSGSLISAGTLTESQWAVVLRNCAVFYGWIVDPVTKQVRKAPQAAFRLRVKEDADQQANIPSALPDPPAPPPEEKPKSTVSLEQDNSLPAGAGRHIIGTHSSKFTKDDQAQGAVNAPGSADQAIAQQLIAEQGSFGSRQTGTGQAYNQAASGQTSLNPLVGDANQAVQSQTESGQVSQAQLGYDPTGYTQSQTSYTQAGSNVQVNPTQPAYDQNVYPQGQTGYAQNTSSQVNPTQSGYDQTGYTQGQTVSAQNGPVQANQTQPVYDQAGNMQGQTGYAQNSSGQASQTQTVYDQAGYAQANGGQAYGQQAVNSQGSLPQPVIGSQGNTTAMQPIHTQPAVPNVRPLGPVAPTSSKGIPNFRTNDDSKIDVALCKHQLAVSLARSDFSSQSTEASVSGGAFGVTVGVSAGYASAESKSHKESSEDSTQTLIARYMFPRCDLFLTSTDLEPTPELASLLAQIGKNKNLKDLRKLQSEFGQFFCQQLSLGARLLSTKIMTSTMKSSEDASKESFKVSVGVSVQTPYGGASVKHEQEKGSEKMNAQSSSDSNETNVFEACGGDTTLAADPMLWGKTVSDYQNWRVVNRDGLYPMVDMISQMPGYEAVQSWFVQAVPAMSKYITLDQSHRFQARFRVMSPTNSLCVEGQPNPAYYLGFHRDDRATPRLTGVDTSTQLNFWIRLDTKQDKVLFEPKTYRAPVIKGFGDFFVGDSQFGAGYNDDFAAVEWTITAPFDTALTNGCRVVLQTVSINRSVKEGGVDTNPPVSHMAVFRNAQGVYLPAISDRDEYQYWRISKLGSDNLGETLKSGDQIRLCWNFQDQTTGFRDFFEDTFGRRQTQCPPDLVGQNLYLKVPWPRLESKGQPTNLILSTVASIEQMPVAIKTKQGDFTYVAQDLQLRIDTVENMGMGDANDYLLKGVTQEGDVSTGSKLTATPFPSPGPVGAGNPMQMWARIFCFGIIS